MKKLLTAFVICFLWACHSSEPDKKPTDTSATVSISGSAANNTDTAYAAREKVNLYSSPSRNAKVKLVLHAPDSMLVECGESQYCGIFYEQWYKVHLRINGQEDTAFVWGCEIAKGCRSDLDDDGQDELLLLGYTRYKDENADKPYDNPGFVQAYKNGQLLCRYAFSGYSNTWFEKLSAKSSSMPVALFRLQNGLEACDYPIHQELLYFSKGTLQLLRHDVVSGNEYAGLSYQYVLPSDSNGEANTIKVFGSLTFNPDEREPGDSDRFDTAVYIYRNSSFHKQYESRHIP